MATENEDEYRLRKVEEAVIEFRHIAKVVLVDMERRIQHLESQSDDHGKQMSELSQAKSEEISEKVDAVFLRFVASMVFLFTLFIGALLYMQGQHDSVSARINEVQAGNIENRTNNANIIRTLEIMDAKLDKLSHKE